MLTYRSLVRFTLATMFIAASPFALAANPNNVAASEDTAQPTLDQTEPRSFTWERVKTTIKPGTRVTFSNGIVLAGTGKDKEISKRMLAQDLKKKHTETIAENDNVYIAAAYPSLGKAQVAIVGQRCIQTECRPQDFKFVVINDDFVKSYSIEDASKVEVQFRDNGEIWAVAQGITMGSDAYGADIRENLEFKPGLGFVSAALNTRFSDLIGKHPDVLLNDSALRDALVSKMGVDEFRRFRESMKVSSGARLIRGKFILLNGCKAHSCSDDLSTLLIDGATGDMWWCSSQEGMQFGTNGATLPAKLRKQRSSELHTLLPSIDLDHEYLTIDVSYDGLLQVLER